MGKQYKLYTNSTGATNAAASLKITKSGRVKCIAFSLYGLGGAGVSRLIYEVSKQNTASDTVNDTPETVMAMAAVASPNATHYAENYTVFCDIPVEVGDTIYINIAFNGAVAPGSAGAQIFLYT